MTQDSYQLQKGAAAIYEQQKVTAIFRPLAEATLSKIDVSNDESVLDIACGTGIVARVVKELVDPAFPVTGVDLNEGMIEAARLLTKNNPGAFRWRIADVTAMPFPDSSFSLAICQQGLQFFPDPGKALSETHRVLQPGGRIILSVWAGASQFFLALARAIETHVSQECATRSLSPFSFKQLKAIPELLGSAGFNAVTMSDLAINRHIENPEEAIPREIMGNPVGPEVSACGHAVMSRIVDDVLKDCSDLRTGTTLTSPQTARVYCARAG
ncbi:class I SAM-dependent methyltransferase [Roseibium sediminicola]|uniref:Methyltransferase domain-containing protein n=1 Tax=Roseibium sediminicola TaxID=2933272 RepID=A0ABT0H196_9HYPH|nr:methyltransferase domain-containing protein [Roseibium sp. CAU 1639]MCK7615441.1 methyltransferase domain-containing protein [Roseibium sp. CAU 1639]